MLGTSGTTSRMASQRLLLVLVLLLALGRCPQHPRACVSIAPAVTSVHLHSRSDMNSMHFLYITVDLLACHAASEMTA